LLHPSKFFQLLPSCCPAAYSLNLSRKKKKEFWEAIAVFHNTKSTANICSFW
jgi:hypothetical protein